MWHDRMKPTSVFFRQPMSLLSRSTAVNDKFYNLDASRCACRMYVFSNTRWALFTAARSLLQSSLRLSSESPFLEAVGVRSAGSF
jgi:hypothetical protein